MSTPENIKPLMSNKLLKSFENYYKHCLQNIASEYNLDSTLILDKFKFDTAKIAIELEIKKRNRRVLSNEVRCMGRKIDGLQCTRSRMTECEFCLSHKKNLHHGRIDDTNYKPPEKGKRGRKRKDFYFENNDDYIATTLEYIDNEKYLVDCNKKVYSHNIENPKFIGILNEHNKIDTLIN